MQLRWRRKIRVLGWISLPTSPPDEAKSVIDHAEVVFARLAVVPTNQPLYPQLGSKCHQCLFDAESISVLFGANPEHTDLRVFFRPTTAPIAPALSCQAGWIRQ